MAEEYIHGKHCSRCIDFGFVELGLVTRYGEKVCQQCALDMDYQLEQEQNLAWAIRKARIDLQKGKNQ
jgi:hypothetical protein